MVRDKRWDCTKDMQLPAQNLLGNTPRQGLVVCFRYANYAYIHSAQTAHTNDDDDE